MRKNTRWASDHRLSKFDRSIVVNLKSVSYFFGVYTNWFLASTILAGSLNSGLTYLITTVCVNIRERVVETWEGSTWYFFSFTLFIVISGY